MREEAGAFYNERVQNIDRWERAEVERSAVEASLTADSSLRVSTRTFTRYERPGADSPYPLEYSYHLLGDVAGLRILDFGCGSGSNTVLLANRGAHVWGFDISEDLLRIAQRRMRLNGRAGEADFIVASAHQLPFPDESIDIVFGIAILHHLDLELVSKEIHRVLRVGGRAIFQEPVRNSPAVRLVRSLIPYRQPDVSPYERPLTAAELRSFAEPFTSFRTRAFRLPHVALAEKLPIVKKKIAPVYRSDRALLGSFPALTYYAGVCVLEVVK